MSWGKGETPGVSFDFAGARNALYGATYHGVKRALSRLPLPVSATGLCIGTGEANSGFGRGRSSGELEKHHPVASKRAFGGFPFASRGLSMEATPKWPLWPGLQKQDAAQESALPFFVENRDLIQLYPAHLFIHVPAGFSTDGVAIPTFVAAKEKPGLLLEFRLRRSPPKDKPTAICFL